MPSAVAKALGWVPRLAIPSWPKERSTSPGAALEALTALIRRQQLSKDTRTTRDDIKNISPLLWFGLVKLVGRSNTTDPASCGAPPEEPLPPDGGIEVL